MGEQPLSFQSEDLVKHTCISENVRLQKSCVERIMSDLRLYDPSALPEKKTIIISRFQQKYRSLYLQKNKLISVLRFTLFSISKIFLSFTYPQGPIFFFFFGLIPFPHHMRKCK